MPEIDLSWLDGIDLCQPGHLPQSVGRDNAAAVLMSVMTWPADEGQRTRFLTKLAGDWAVAHYDATTSAAVIAKMFLTALAVGDDEVIHEIVTTERQIPLDAVTEKYGGLAAVIEAISDDSLLKTLSTSNPAWRVVGHILRYVEAINHAEVKDGSGRRIEGSVNKAIRMIEDKHSQLNGIIGKTKIREAWSSYKNVAHLCAAMNDILYFMTEAGAKTFKLDFVFYEFLHVFLYRARSYQVFATKFIPHGRNEPLIDPTAIWRISDGLTLPNTIRLPGSLTEAHRTELSKYRVPNTVCQKQYDSRR